MDFNSALDIIINDLAEARAILEDLKNYPGVPRLQVELAKTKCKSAEEILSLLKTIQDSPAQEDQPVRESQLRAAQAPDETEKAVPDDSPGVDKDVVEAVAPGEEKKVRPDETPVEKVSEQVKAAEKEADVKEDLTILELGSEEEKDPEPARKTKKEKADNPILADRFSKISSFADEQLGTHKRDDDISSVMKSKPVLNLKDAIGLNDKFLYIRELFDGDPARYEEAITRLNETPRLEEARTMIMSLVDNDEENEVALQLIDLVKRKLSSDG